MSLNNKTLTNELLDKTLWWRYSFFGGESSLLLSPKLESLFVSPIIQLEDMTGCYITPILKLRIQEILDNPHADVRFSVSYETRHGKMSFQHQLHVYSDQESETGQRYVLATCMDVTEMVALEREIVDAQGRLSVTQVTEREAFLEKQNQFINESYQKQSRFLAMLSHELRSPLLGISSLVQRLRENQTDETVLTALKAIHITAEQSIFLVNDILTYSQTEYDEITLHPMAFSLRETLDNVKQLTRSIAADKGLIVSLVYLGERDMVVGDSVRLSQVLINLIVNSIKFTQYGGVTIEVNQDQNNHFLFKVTDSGEGIAADQLERIFEPYAQLANIGNTQHIGSGLGLLVVKQLVSLMGGAIFVESTLGVGTSFNFNLVLADPELQPLLKSTSLSNEPVLVEKVSVDNASIDKTFVDKPSLVSLKVKKVNILIADDSKINLMVLGGYLQELNCSVVEAKNGREAWDLFLENTFDYVFLDIQMPFLDGIEVSQKIKECVLNKCQAAKNLKKVFAVTAGGDESNFTLEQETAASNGFDHWFVKPVSKAQIISVLQQPDSELVEKSPPPSTLSDNAIELKNKIAGVTIQAFDRLDNKSDEQKMNDNWEGIEDIPEQFQGLMDEFLRDLNSGFSELDKLIQAENTSELTKKAHYLKGNCMLLQLNGMVSFLREIEKTAQNSGSSLGDKQDKLILILEKLDFGLKYLEKSIAIRHNVP